jgi:hypothetical protein
MGALASSFRDPSGHVFVRDGRLLRQVNERYAAEYDHLIDSGLYRTLSERGLLVPHEEVAERADIGAAHRILRPEPVPFVSYPFEWAFSQLKAAALATLAIQRLAVERGMVLKDASAYNLQFVGSAPVFIDTLSFERWHEGTPWLAYRQFCQHFLGPLALMSATDVRLGALSRVYIDGPPLDLVSELLPVSSRFQPALLMHLHLHARSQAKHGGAAIDGAKPAGFSRRSMLGLVDHLQSAIDRLAYTPQGTTWVEYYAHTNYTDQAMTAKQRIVAAMLGAEKPQRVWDLGANTGVFSRLAVEAGAYAVAIVADPAAVERAVVEGQARRESRMLPLVMDLSNPTGGMGWAHQERQSLVERGPADVVLALGLIHHLTLANQVPFAMSADFFARIARTLIVEFVPPADSQAAGMLSRMPDGRARYARDGFESAYGSRFDVCEVVPIPETERSLYRLHRRESAEPVAFTVSGKPR